MDGSFLTLETLRNPKNFWLDLAEDASSGLGGGWVANGGDREYTGQRPGRQNGNLVKNSCEGLAPHAI